MVICLVARSARRSVGSLACALAVAACGLAVLAGCGTEHAGPARSPARAANPGAAVLTPRQRAEADAARIIAAFPRPPRAVRTGLIASLTGAGVGPPATPDVVTATRWWRAPGQPQAVLAWVRAHMPAGFTLAVYGDGSYQPTPSSVILPESWTDAFALPVIPNVLTQRWLVVLAVPGGAGQTALRVDAQVVWLPARPASERIPPDARVVTVTPVFGLQPDRALARLDHAVTVTSPAAVARIAALIDGLHLFPPGTFGCPADFGAAMRLTFRTRPGGPVVAVLSAGYDGCEIATLTVGGRDMPALAEDTGSGPSLQDRVLALAGIRWPYPPGTPPA